VTSISPRAQAVDPYRHPELFQWTGYMEGVPEWVDPKETPEARAARAPWQQRANEFLERAGTLLPGITIAVGLAAVGRVSADWVGLDLMGFEKSPVSPILVAIAIGLLVRNTIGVPSIYGAGLQLALKRVLRIGVALLGIRLSLSAVGAIGLLALPVVVACIATALILVTAVNRALGLPRRLGTLVAVGTAICGNTAIVATGPVIGADEDEVSYAVGCVTVFGLLALVFYPFLSHAIFAGDPTLAGFFLGTAIHDTAQVAGAGMLYLQQYGAPEALDTATVTKLVRNLFMVAVIPLMALLYHRGGDRPTGKRPPFAQMVPLFVFGFVAMALLRSVGDLGAEPFGGALARESWDRTIDSVSAVSAWCLTIAMASVGLGTNLKRLRSLGLKPSVVGLAAALIVGAVSAGVLALMRPLIAQAG
jgi:uncharacterized integral membrane protein (TIGR00698 family)